MAQPISGEADANHPGVLGTGIVGVEGIGIAGVGVGVHGVSGVTDPTPLPFTGVWGEGGRGAGFIGAGARFGVQGTVTAPFGSGVQGTNSENIGVEGFGRFGVSGDGQEVGVRGFCDAGVAVEAHTKTGIGILAQGPTAGRFEGNVEVTGNINGQATSTITCFDVKLIGADCAEEFDLADEGEGVSPGTVMVIDNEGSLQTSQEAYDRRVAGIVSGAGDCKPGITLDKRSSQSNRMPIALVGKVYCKADAQYGRINIGDLLTTSPTPGHAMKADDPIKAFGAVIGKALRPLVNGQGLIPVLVALQ
jgi:hypothetical protein